MTTGMMRGDFSFLVLAGGVALLLGFLVPNAGAEQPATQSQQAEQAAASAAAPASTPALQPGQAGSLPSARRLFFSPERGAFFSFPVEPVLALLLKQPEFTKGELAIVTSREDADLLIQLDRTTGTWDFTYLMIHPASGTVVGSGKVVAWDGVRAAPGISSQIIKRLRELRGTAPANKKRA